MKRPNYAEEMAKVPDEVLNDAIRLFGNDSVEEIARSWNDEGIGLLARCILVDAFISELDVRKQR